MSAPGTMEAWVALEQTPEEARKNFRRAGYSGTAINATWQYRRLTEVFGPIGIGWGYHIVQENISTFAGPHGKEEIHQLQIAFWYKWGGEVSVAVPAIGCTTIAGWWPPSNGKPARAYVDEEAAKKSLTDAIGNAAQRLGIGADIRLGIWEDKYCASQPEAPEPTPARRLYLSRQELVSIVTAGLRERYAKLVWAWWGDDAPPPAGEPWQSLGALVGATLDELAAGPEYPVDLVSELGKRTLVVLRARVDELGDSSSEEPSAEAASSSDSESKLWS